MVDDPKYITRLMRIRCDKGTMDNYINVGTDHGVLAGADQQPVLNANDHTKENIIHCGNCESDENPERMFRKRLVAGCMGPIGALIGNTVTDLLEDVGIMTCKCKPNTPVPWIYANENNILEGAPALTMNSTLACRYGGVITFVPLDEYPEEQPVAEEEGQEPDKQEEDGVGEAAAAALEAALGKVAATGETGEAAVADTAVKLQETNTEMEQAICNAVEETRKGVSYENIKGIFEDARLEAGEKQVKVLQNIVSGIDPVVQTVKAWEPQKEGTKSIAVSAAGTPSVFPFDIGIVVVADHKGNIGAQWPLSGGVPGESSSVNLGISVQETDAEGISDLLGNGYNIGGSVGAECMLGGDSNIIPRQDGGYYYGAAVTGGTGAGGEIHVTWGETREIESLKVNLYDQWDCFKEVVDSMKLKEE